MSARRWRSRCTGHVRRVCALDVCALCEDCWQLLRCRHCDPRPLEGLALLSNALFADPRARVDNDGDDKSLLGRVQRAERHAHVECQPSHKEMRHVEASQPGEEGSLVELLVVVKGRVAVNLGVGALVDDDVLLVGDEVGVALGAPRALHAVSRP